MEKKGVGINPASLVHYMDHLAVVCVIMGIPLIFIEPDLFEMGKKNYPGLDALLLEYGELTQEYLITNYDVLFMSDLQDKYDFHARYAQLEQKYQKILRHVHCPHGFSDKGFYLKKCAIEDIVLIYGQNMIDLLKHHGVFELLKNYVRCGNYRYAYFKQHRQFYDELIQNDVLSHFARKQPVILYAPTWKDLEDSTTFFDAYADILGKLPDSYNMIVKLHPRLEEDDPAMFYHIVGKYETKPNVLFFKNFSLVYPLLAHTDIYLGDTSSVGYDFLPFDKPMFFLNKAGRDAQADRGLYLFRCGVEIKPEAYSTMYQVMEANLKDDRKHFSEIRRDVYQYTFGEERPFGDIKADIVRAYNKPLM